MWYNHARAFKTELMFTMKHIVSYKFFLNNFLNVINGSAMLTTLIQLCQSVEFLLVSRKCNIARGKHSKRENSSPRASACYCAITIGEKGGGGGGTKRRTKRTKRRTRECAFGQGDPDGLQQAPRRRRQLQLHLLRRKEGTG